jgi:hypothetical protein
MHEDAPRACDYEIAVSEADMLKGAVDLPAEFRTMILAQYLQQTSPEALVTLFAQFMGLANAVITNNRTVIEEALVVKMGMEAYRAEQVNLPTLFGALNGIALAAKVQQKTLCRGCAFRHGTPANQSPVTTCDAESMFAEDDALFMCHEAFDAQGEPTRKCRGFTQTKKWHRARKRSRG